MHILQNYCKGEINKMMHGKALISDPKYSVTISCKDPTRFKYLEGRLCFFVFVLLSWGLKMGGRVSICITVCQHVKCPWNGNATIFGEGVNTLFIIHA